MKKEKECLLALSAFVLLIVAGVAEANAWYPYSYPQRTPTEYNVYEGVSHNYTQCVVEYTYNRTTTNYYGDKFNIYNPVLGATIKADNPPGVYVLGRTWFWWDYSMCANYASANGFCSKYGTSGYNYQYCMNNRILGMDGSTRYVKI